MKTDKSLPNINIPPHLHSLSPQIHFDDLTNGTTIYQGDYCDVIKLTKNGKTYAIKNIYKQQLPKNQYNSEIQQIINEIKVLYLIQHPNVIQLLGHIETDQSIMLIFPYFGKPLSKFIKAKKKREGNPYTLQIFIKIFRQIIMAINEIHCLGYVHRDLSSDNILIDQQFNLKLCDFGYVNHIYGRKTETGSCQYLAPQILQGRKYNHKVDIWALGILSFELLYGICMFEPQRKNLSEQEIKREYLKNMMNPIIELSDQQLIVTDKPSIEMLSNLKCLLNVNPEKRPETGYLLSRKIFGAQRNDAGKYEIQQFVRQKTQTKTNKLLTNMDISVKQMSIAQLQHNLFGLINIHANQLQHQQKLLQSSLNVQHKLSQLRAQKYRIKQTKSFEYQSLNDMIGQ